MLKGIKMQDIYPFKGSQELLYENGDFAVAAGVWNGVWRVGLRWTGGRAGYPHRDGYNPCWFCLPEGDLAVDFLKNLIAKDSADNAKIIQAIEKLQKQNTKGA